MKLKEKLAKDYSEWLYDYPEIASQCFLAGFESAKTAAFKLAASIDESWVESFSDLGEEEIE